jgi:hypothetical protein
MQARKQELAALTLDQRIAYDRAFGKAHYAGKTDELCHATGMKAAKEAKEKGK